MYGPEDVLAIALGSALDPVTLIAMPIAGWISTRLSQLALLVFVYLLGVLCLLTSAPSEFDAWTPTFWVNAIGRALAYGALGGAFMVARRTIRSKKPRAPDGM